MSRAASLGFVRWDTESSWGEDVGTFTKRLAILGSVDTSKLVHAKVASGRVVQYRNDDTQHIRGVMEASFTTRVYLPGHGSSTSGSPTLTDFETLLGYVFGQVALSASASTTATGGTAAAPTTTAASGFTIGALGRLGVLGDGRANGQWFAVTTHSSNTLTLRTALPAAPTTSDVVFPAATIYPNESASSATVQPLRFELGSANQIYECHGCFPMAVRFSGLSNGQLPTLEIDWGVSWFEPVAGTFPTATSVDVHNPAPVACGSFFMQTAGTSTRATKTVRDFTLDYQLGITPIMGPGGVNSFQRIIGATRTPDAISFTFTVDADSATATPTEGVAWDADSETGYHILYDLNVAAGKSVAFYFPRALYVGNKPVQQNVDGLNREVVTMRACTGGSTVSELTLSSMRMGLA
jgi:hypothetical protein